MFSCLLLLLSVLFFMMSHTFSIGDRSAAQSSTFTLSKKHAVVEHAELDLAFSWYNNHGLPMKYIILMAVYLCKIPIYASMSIVPSHIWHSPMQFALLHHHTMTDICFCLCHWWKYGWSFWFLGLRTHRPFLAETSWNVDSSEYRTDFHCLFDNLRWALAQRTQQHSCIELMFSFLLEIWIFKLHFFM